MVEDNKRPEAGYDLAFQPQAEKKSQQYRFLGMPQNEFKVHHVFTVVHVASLAHVEIQRCYICSGCEWKPSLHLLAYARLKATYSPPP